MRLSCKVVTLVMTSDPCDTSSMYSIVYLRLTHPRFLFVQQYRKVSENHLGPPSTENGPPAYSSQLDDVLPAGLEFRDEGQIQ